MVRRRTKPTSHVRQYAWLLPQAAIRERTKGRDEPVALGSLIVVRNPDVARREGLKLGSPELASAERFLERRGHLRPITVGKEPKAFLVTDAGRTWLGQHRWSRLWWRGWFGV